MLATSLEAFGSFDLTYLMQRKNFRYDELISHLEKKHENIYEEHHAFRAPLSLEKDHKKYKKSKVVSSVRFFISINKSYSFFKSLMMNFQDLWC